MKKDLSELIDWATDNGWSVSRTNKNHLRFEKPERRMVFGSGTPSDWRSVKNMRMKLVREDRVKSKSSSRAADG